MRNANKINFTYFNVRKNHFYNIEKEMDLSNYSDVKKTRLSYPFLLVCYTYHLSPRIYV